MGEPPAQSPLHPLKAMGMGGEPYQLKPWKAGEEQQQKETISLPYFRILVEEPRDPIERSHSGKLPSTYEGSHGKSHLHHRSSSPTQLSCKSVQAFLCPWAHPSPFEEMRNHSHLIPPSSGFRGQEPTLSSCAGPALGHPWSLALLLPGKQGRGSSKNPW